MEFYCDRGDGHAGDHHNGNIRERKPAGPGWQRLPRYEAPTLTELHGAEAEEARTIVAGVVIVDGPGDPCDDCGRVPCTCR